MDSPSDGCSPPEERVLHDSSVDRSLSTTVVLAVSRAQGVEPTELPPLARTVNPDALDKLFQTTDDGRSPVDGSVRFEFDGQQVCVRSGGEVTVRSSLE